MLWLPNQQKKLFYSIDVYELFNVFKIKLNICIVEEWSFGVFAKQVFCTVTHFDKKYFTIMLLMVNLGVKRTIIKQNIQAPTRTMDEENS